MVAQRAPVRAVILSCDGDRERTAGRLNHAPHGGELDVEVAEVGDDLEDTARARHPGGDADELGLCGGERRCRLATAGPVVHRARGGEAERAGGDRVAHDPAHLQDLVGGCRLARRASFAHHVEADGSVRHLGGEVDVVVPGVEVVEVLGEALPIPRKAFVKCGAGDVLDALHQLDESLAVAGPAWSETHTTVAHHHRCHPVPCGRKESVVPRGEAVIVGVDVDEARHDERAVGVDDACPLAVGGVDLTDLDDVAARDRDIGRAGRCAGAVDDRATADDEVVGCHVVSLAPVPRARVALGSRPGARPPPPGTASRHGPVRAGDVDRGCGSGRRPATNPRSRLASPR